MIEFISYQEWLEQPRDKEVKWLIWINRHPRSVLAEKISVLTKIDYEIVELAINIVKDIQTLNDLRLFLEQCPELAVLLEEYKIEEIPDYIKNEMRKEFIKLKFVYFKIISILVTLLDKAIDKDIRDETEELNESMIIQCIKRTQDKVLLQIIEVLSQLLYEQSFVL